MLERLLESSPRRSRSPRDLGLSVALHAGMILVAITATRGAVAIVRDAPLNPPFVIGVAPGGATTSSSAGARTAPPLDPAPRLPLAEAPWAEVGPDATLAGRPDDGSGPASAPRRVPPGIVPQLDGLPRAQAPQGRFVEVDRPVEPIEGPRPAYPARLRAAAIEGTVRLRFVVTAAGVVDSTTIAVVRSTHPAFDTAAVHALMRWRFRPARRDGRPVAQVVEQNVRFDLGREG